MTQKTCAKCGNSFDLTPDHFYRYASSPDGYTSACKACYNSARGSRGTRAKKAGSAPRAKSTIVNGYIASPGLLQVFDAVVSDEARDEDGYALNMFFVGPSGSGKTEGARALSTRINLDFVKVDASAMTDPESWFGTREVIAKDGVPVTIYRPSVFVEAIQRPCVLLIDEANRIRDEDRNIILPLTDGTHSIVNPLNGETIVRDPNCIVILSGNRGFQFTGTFAIDPALMTRAITMEFGYLDAANETAVLTSRTGVDDDTARTLVRFANDIRGKVARDPDLLPISTRELLAAARLVKGGAPADVAVAVAILNGASDEGGASSARQKLINAWGAVRKPTA